MMNEIEFESFLKNVGNFINYGKSFPFDNQELLKLNTDQKIIYHNYLKQEMSNILSPDPTSYAHSLLCVLQYGTNALKRACITSCVIGIAYWGVSQEFSLPSTFNKMLMTGTLTFFGSISYDSATLPNLKLKRIQILKNELGPVDLNYKSNIFFCKT